MSDIQLKEEKKKKKEKKEKREKEMDAEEPVEVLIEESRKEKKEKKSKKSKEEKAPVEVEEVVVEESSSKKSKKRSADEMVEDSSSKKSKKEKKSSSGDVPSMQMYKIHPETAALCHKKIGELQSQWHIQVIPEESWDTIKPITQFDYLRPSLTGHCPYILKYIQDKGFSTPTAIQAQCWPALLQGNDIIGIAATGSGKTLAFLIPAMLKIAYMNENNITAGESNQSHLDCLARKRKCF